MGIQRGTRGTLKLTGFSCVFPSTASDSWSVGASMTGPQAAAAAWYLRVQADVIEDRQSKTLLTNETVQRLRALRQRQWQKAAADFNKRQDAASARADASIAAWLAAHKERVALGMTTDGGTTTDHCDTEGMTEEVAAENAPPLVNGNGYVWAEDYGGRPGWVLCIE